MNLLAPLFLLGAAAVLGPVIYHLVRRTTRERLRFSSLLFLQASPPRLAQRQRVEHWLLLLLRCLALLLLALGFARPFFPAEAPPVVAGEPSRSLVVLVDTSASLRRTGLWAQARAKAEAALRSLGPNDRAEVMVFGSAPRVLFSSADWTRVRPEARVAAVVGRLSATEPGYESTNLGAALVAAADRLGESSSGRSFDRREVLVISDFQAGARMDALQAQEWPRDVVVRIDAVTTSAAPTNAGVQLVAAGDAAGRGEAGMLRVRVANAAESKREQFKINWARPDGGTVGPGVEAYVPPGQSRLVRLPPAPIGSGADRVVLQGDDEPFDNTLYVIPPLRRTARVVGFGGGASDDPKGAAYFLRRALSDTPAISVQLETLMANALPGGAAPDFTVVMSPLAAPTADLVRGWLEGGATVLAVAESVDLAATLARLTGRGAVRLTEATVENYAMLGEVEFQHPLFAAFADPRFNDFTKVRFWRHRVIDPTALGESRVLARFDRGAPAVMEVPVGRGRLYVLTAGWAPSDSQLALSSKFVPLLWSWLELGGAKPDAPGQLLVGDSWPLSAGHGGGSLRGPAGGAISVAPAVKALGPFAEPGIYEWSGAGRSERFAVNLDPAESRTSPLNREQWEERGLPAVRPPEVNSPGRAETEQLAAAAVEERQKVWRWALVAALFALALEMVLAGRTSRSETMPEASRS